MIDPNTETIAPRPAAAGERPRRRGGKKPHVSCLYRWTKTGCKGVILESLQVGGTRCTSREALARFFHRLTAAAAPSSTAAAGNCAAEQTERELADAGI